MVSDVIGACSLLADFTRGKRFDDYAADALLRSAVERQLEIIGEALRVAAQHQPGLESAGGVHSGEAVAKTRRNQLMREKFQGNGD